MSTAARRRLMRDFKVRHQDMRLNSSTEQDHGEELLLTRLLQRMQTDPPAGVSASPIADNVMTWYDSPHFTPHATPLNLPDTLRPWTPLSLSHTHTHIHHTL
jgi:hypothetical protein